MASRSISVKVATPKVIKALETKLADIKKNYAEQEVNEAKYQKDMEKYRKALTDYALANIKKATNIRTNHRSWNNSLNIDFDVDTKGADFPTEPVREFEMLHSHAYKELVEDIQNALNILKMTDEETVNATTMKSIAQYL
jgi:DNA repair exonuclease SbcCD ATPase subunit